MTTRYRNIGGASEMLTFRLRQTRQCRSHPALPCWHSSDIRRAALKNRQTHRNIFYHRIISFADDAHRPARRLCLTQEDRRARRFRAARSPAPPVATPYAPAPLTARGRLVMHNWLLTLA